MLMLIKIAFPFCLIEVNELCNCIQFNIAFCGYKNCSQKAYCSWHA